MTTLFTTGQVTDAGEKRVLFLQSLRIQATHQLLPTTTAAATNSCNTRTTIVLNKEVARPATLIGRYVSNNEEKIGRSTKRSAKTDVNQIRAAVEPQVDDACVSNVFQGTHKD